MKKIIIFFTFTSLIIIALASLLMKRSYKYGIEVNTQPAVKIIIDGTEAGMTPYRNNNLVKNKINLKMDGGIQNQWSRQLKLEKNVSTVINWTFGKNSNYSGGYVLSMEKFSLGELPIMISSSPTQAGVYINGEQKGSTPLYIKDIGTEDKEIKIVMPGYKTIVVGVRPVTGYRLIVEAVMSRDEIQKPVNTKNETIVVENIIKKVRIKETGTGWLRMRQENNSAARELAKINTGEIVELKTEEKDWYQIIYGGTIGWISAKYAEKI